MSASRTAPNCPALLGYLFLSPYLFFNPFARVPPHFKKHKTIHSKLISLMKNLKKKAPYVYLTKSAQEGHYMIFLLVPVGPSMDVNLTNVQPVSHSDHFLVEYSTASASIAETYRLKHWTVEKGNKDYVKVTADNDPDLTNRIYFDYADDEVATASADGGLRQAPYIYVGKETEGAVTYARPSCIVLFDSIVGVQSEAISVEGENCFHNIVCGESNVLTTQAAHFSINQDLRVKLTGLGQVPYFEALVEQITGIASLAMGGDKKKRKVTTRTPTPSIPNGNGGYSGSGEMEAVGEGAFRSGIWGGETSNN